MLKLPVLRIWLIMIMCRILDDSRQWHFQALNFQVRSPVHGGAASLVVTILLLVPGATRPARLGRGRPGHWHDPDSEARASCRQASCRRELEPGPGPAEAWPELEPPVPGCQWDSDSGSLAPSSDPTKTRTKIVLALARVKGYSTVPTELWTD